MRQYRRARAPTAVAQPTDDRVCADRTRRDEAVGGTLVGDVPGEPLPPMPTEASSKAVWRRWSLARRQALAAADPRRTVEHAVAEHLLRWPPWRGARVALVYLAFGSELDPLAGGLRPGLLNGPADAATVSATVSVTASQTELPLLATTRTPPGGDDLQVRALASDALERHPLGFLQPRSDAPAVPLDRIDLVLVPGLCFDHGGARLGYGRGYYDRLLPLLPPHVVTVGVVHDALVTQHVPREPHDALVRFLVSESGVRATGA